MAAREVNKMKLSKSILEMKFMKRTKEKVENQLFREEGEEYFGNQLTKRMKTESGRFIHEPSFAFCEQLRDGRVSYRGMNIEIENLMELEEKAKRAKEQTKREVDVSDQQMAKRWKSSDVTTMANKFKTKKRRHHDSSLGSEWENENLGEKRKFLKPTD